MSFHTRDELRINRHNFSVQFHEEFEKFFKKSPLEINQNAITPANETWKVNSDYIGKIFLNADSQTIRNFFKQDISLADDIAHQANFIEKTREYFLDTNYSREAYIAHNRDFPELASYISGKFPKSHFNQEDTIERVNSILH